jgi:hypothetical protein
VTQHHLHQRLLPRPRSGASVTPTVCIPANYKIRHASYKHQRTVTGKQPSHPTAAHSATARLPPSGRAAQVAQHLQRVHLLLALQAARLVQLGAAARPSLAPRAARLRL